MATKFVQSTINPSVVWIDGTSGDANYIPSKTWRRWIDCGTKKIARLVAAAPETEAERDKLREQRGELLAVITELQESASYWSEYDVPLGIVDRINSAIAKAGGEA